MNQFNYIYIRSIGVVQISSILREFNIFLAKKISGWIEIK